MHLCLSAKKNSTSQSRACLSPDQHWILNDSKSPNYVLRDFDIIGSVVAL